MIWHIFKKDLRLLWKFALAVAILPFAHAAVRFRIGHEFAESDVYPALLLLFEIMLYFGAATLTATLVHLDGLVSVRQDWLVRPIRRRDLLAAKLLFLALAVQLPLFLANLAGGLAAGSSLSVVFSAAFTENLYFLFGFALPILAFASLTRNMTEALGGAFVFFIAVVGLEVLFIPLNGGAALGPTTGTGIAWIPQSERMIVYTVAAAAILALQYLRRAAPTSRAVLGAAAALCLLTQILPWRYAFGFETALSGAAPAARSIAIRFDPAAGKYQSPVPDDPAQPRLQMGASGLRRTDYVAPIYLPIRIAGLGAGSLLKIDRASVHLVNPGGKTGQTLSPGTDPLDFSVSGETADGSAPLPYFEPLRISSTVLERIKNTPVAIRIDYSATLLKLVSTNVFSPYDADRRIPHIGWCQTRLNDSRTTVQLRCLSVGNPPQCLTALLENPATGVHNPAIQGCLNDYSPYFGRYKPSDPIMVGGANLRFRDEAGLLHYPVGASQLGSAQVVLRSYAVVGHFSRSLVIPSIRLADWAAD